MKWWIFFQSHRCRHVLIPSPSPLTNIWHPECIFSYHSFNSITTFSYLHIYIIYSTNTNLTIFFNFLKTRFFIITLFMLKNNSNNLLSKINRFGISWNDMKLFNRMDFQYNMVDKDTIKQLKESNYYHPVITDVIHSFFKETLALSFSTNKP